MMQIVKRLELISAAIYLKELQIVQSQTKKLQEFPLDHKAKIIHELLTKGLYDESLPQIKNYIRTFSDIKAYEDPRLEKAKVEVKTLEQELCNLSFQKYETILKFYSFNKRYYEVLGNTIKEVLKLQLEIATKALNEQRIKKEEFNKVESRYVDFIHLDVALENIKQNSLTTTKEDELKKLYKQTLNAIHPHIVVAEYKAEANNLFAKLNLCFIQKDLTQLQMLIQPLKKDIILSYSFDTIEDSKKLKKQSKTLMENISVLQKELQELKKNPLFPIVESKESMEHFFTQTKNKLIKKQLKLKELGH